MSFFSCPHSYAAFQQLDGIFVLNKPSGPSSAQCLKLFKKMGQKKIGHAGTLDPLASGVLLVLLGQATKLSGHLQAGGEKIYRGLIKLGEESDTWDSQGQILSRKEWGHIDREMVEAEIRAWKGSLEQEIPPFSAAKHNGQPLYKLARKQLPVPLKTKKIEISHVDILKIGMPYVDFRVTCSSGSYIRSLAHSLGKRLGCGAILCELTREYSHPYSLENATGHMELESSPELLLQRLKPLQSALPNWPLLSLSGREAMAIRNGRTLAADDLYELGQEAILLEDEKPLALVRLVQEEEGRCWRIIRGLWN